MDSVTRRFLWLISFNFFTALFCFGVGIYVLMRGNIISAVVNFGLAGLNVSVGVLNYSTMQRSRKIRGLDPFMIRHIKVPVPVYEFVQKYLYK